MSFAGTFSKVAFVFSATAFIACAQTLSVCEVLSKLSSFGGQRVQIDGNFTHGDTGGRLWSISPCKNPTVRDGWRFVDAIAVNFSSLEVENRITSPYLDFSRSHRGRYTIATVSGQLEASEHFEVWVDGFGVSRPQGFKRDFPARIVVSDISHLKAIQLSPSATAEIIERRGHTEPTRVQ